MYKLGKLNISLIILLSGFSSLAISVTTEYAQYPGLSCQKVGDRGILDYENTSIRNLSNRDDLTIVCTIQKTNISSSTVAARWADQVKVSLILKNVPQNRYTQCWTKVLTWDGGRSYLGDFNAYLGGKNVWDSLELPELYQWGYSNLICTLGPHAELRWYDVSDNR